MTEHVAFWVLIVGMLAFISSVSVRHAMKASKFNFDDLLLGSDGRASKAGWVLMTSWTALTYVFVLLTFQGKVSVDYFWAYGTICILPFVIQQVGGTVQDIIELFRTVRGSDARTRSSDPQQPDPPPGPGASP